MLIFEKNKACPVALALLRKTLCFLGQGCFGQVLLFY